MRDKRFRAITLVEVIVVVAIIAVLSTITFSVFGAVKRRSTEGTCQTRFMMIAGALAMYRTDWGSVALDVGSTERLGLPNRCLALRPNGINSELEAERYFLCPSMTPSTGFWAYNWMPRFQSQQRLGNITMSQISSVLHNETPVMTDLVHNSFPHDFRSPRVSHNVLWLSLGGSAKVEMMKGIALFHPLFVGFNMEQWLRYRDYEAWRRFIYGALP